jgi:hypothetical protein
VHIGNGDANEGEVYEECKDEAIKNYGNFVALWKDAAALHAQHSVQAAAVQDECAHICGANSICRTACEVDMYECFDVNTPTSEDNIKTCQADVLKKHQGVVSFALQHKGNGATSRHRRCEAACSDSFCQTECEVGMYECFDTNTPTSEGKIQECQKAVVDKVKKEYVASFMNAHNLLVRHNNGDWQAHLMNAEDRHHCQEQCNEVCGIDAQCAASCEVEMYTCYDVNTPKSTDKIAPCQEATLKAHLQKHRSSASLLATKPKTFLEPSAI